MATRTYRYCDGCDAPIAKPFVLKVGWVKPNGWDQAVHEYELCEICFYAHCDILDPKTWPRIPEKQKEAT